MNKKLIAECEIYLFIHMNNYIMSSDKNILGYGNYGKVISLAGNDNVARKYFKRPGIEDFFRELFYLILLKNSLRISQILSYSKKKFAYINLNRYQGNLSELSKELPFYQRIYYAQIIANQMLKTLEMLHYHGIIHSDVKLANILYRIDRKNGKLTTYLADFGISNCGNFILEHQTPNCIYNPPETLQQYSKQIDLWMLGASLYHFIIANFKLPFKNASYPDYISIREYYPNLYIPKKLDQLISSLLQKDPQLRLSFPVHFQLQNANLPDFLKRLILTQDNVCSEDLFYLKNYFNKMDSIREIQSLFQKDYLRQKSFNEIPVKDLHECKYKCKKLGYTLGSA